MPKLTAKTADKHALYEAAVQCVEADIDFVERRFKKRFGRKPRVLREDFCGTAAAAVEFVSRGKDNHAIGVDLDEDVLAWGRENNLPRLGKRRGDVELLCKNVMDVTAPQVDVVLAMNFSYFLFQEREDLKAYFANALLSLHSEGLMVLDAYGGTEAQTTCREKKKKDGFTYVWEQHSFNPITSEAVNFIHFQFPDGTKMKRAFRYEWRLWSLREICDLLREVGFARTDVYWEGWDEELEEGDGIFRRRTKAENCEGWIAYIVAQP